MANKYMNFLWNFDNFALIRLATVIQGFLTLREYTSAP